MSASPERFPLSLAAVLAIGLIFFGPHAANAGLHLDDSGFLWSFLHADARALWELTTHYVPGRNLYIPLFYALYRLCGADPARMHLAGLGLDLLNVSLVWLLIRRLGAGRGTALAAASFFMLWPSHAETHWWTSAIIMNLFSTTLLLAAALAAVDRRLCPRSRLLLCGGLFLPALFDYDQVFLLWIPILALARRDDPRGMTARRLATAAASFLSMNAAHFALRMLWPYSSGGRPTPDPAQALQSAGQALKWTLVPLRHPPDLSSFPGGPAAAAVAAVVAGAALSWTCARSWDEEDSTGSAGALAAFGLAWWACAYAPNLLWYISPRHNYLPSVGLAAIAAAAAVVAARRGALRKPLFAAGAGMFALFGAAAWSDGRAWADAATEVERFAETAERILPRDGRGVFLANAPRSIRRAPAFQHPQEHLYALARRTGDEMRPGDVSMALNRRGIFFRNQRDLFGDSPPSFSPLDSSRVIARDPDGSFRLVCGVSLVTAGLPDRKLLVGPDRCPASVTMAAPVALIDSRETSDPRPLRGSLAAEPAGAEITAAPDGGWDLTLAWSVGSRPGAELAAYATLLDGTGRVAWSPSFAPSAEEHAASWPLYDDAFPANLWSPGVRVVEKYRLARQGRTEAKPANLRLEIFSRSAAGAWSREAIRDLPLENSKP